MDGPHITLNILLVLFCSHNCISSSVLEVKVRHGDNVTLYCDCRVALGIYIIWYRNCSHENQPQLALKFNTEYQQKKRFARYEFQKNFSSDSYNLVISNTTSSDEGLYYCGTNDPIISSKEIYKYGNITTRLIVKSSEIEPENCGLCWTLLSCLCPAISVVSALISSVSVHLLCRKT
ncbi:putative LOC107374343-like protein, partial [Nothobranchius furzeri]